MQQFKTAITLVYTELSTGKRGTSRVHPSNNCVYNWAANHLTSCGLLPKKKHTPAELIAATRNIDQFDLKTALDTWQTTALNIVNPQPDQDPR